ncbi:MAG: hypothetical protein WA993_17015 [Candidatus Binatus sp.]|jgi:hypothetical protein
MPLFNFCLVCDDVRIEQGGKALIIGFYGMVPYVEIGVTQPSAPIPRLTFVLISGPPIVAGRYHIVLSVKDPQGREVLNKNPAPIDQDVAAGPFNAIIYLQPMPLNGVGTYTVTAIVNGKADFTGKLFINQGSPAANVNY